MTPGPRRLEWDTPAPGDLFDHLEATPMSPNQPRADNPARAIRVEDHLWQAAREAAAKENTTPSAVMRQALQALVERHR